MLISAINEIYYWNSSESLRIVSLVTAFALLMLFIVLLWFTLFLSLSSYKTIENEHSKIGEIFNGFKMQRKHKIFASALLLRRLIFVAVLISLMRISSPIVIGILGFAQLVYLIITFILRPYKQVKENLILIINEIYFGSILCSLAYFNSEDKWSDTITSIYVWIFTSNSMISLTIVLGNLIFLKIIVYTVKYIITKIVSRWSKSRVSQFWINTIDCRINSSSNSSKIKKQNSNFVSLYFY